MDTSDILLFVSTLIIWFQKLWSAFGTWGLVGAFIIGMPIVRKISVLLKNLFKGGL